MSVYWVNFVCRELVKEPAFRAEMKADPERALAAYRLTPAEKTALVGGDVGTLYRLGANGFLLGYLCRYEIAGLTLESYGERMRAVLRADRSVDLPPEVASAEPSHHP